MSMQSRGSRVRRLLGASGRILSVPVGLAAFVSLAFVATDVKLHYEVDQEKKSSKKKVLMIPFHQLELVECKKLGISSKFGNKRNGISQQEVRELVKTIRAAAEDPNVIALYGIFGHGFRFKTGGWAHVDEVRTAIEDFGKGPSKKQLFAYADTFDNPMDSGNTEYYLATAFSNICMQSHGVLNLFGVSMTTSFFHSFLQRNGIKVHVFKQGKYKNAGNMFTHSGFTREHRENVTNIVQSTDKHISQQISTSRDQPNMSWEQLRRFGSFTAPQARELGLIDETKEVMPASFPGIDEVIPLSQYQAMASKRDKVETKRKHWRLFQDWFMDVLTYQTGKHKVACEKVALLYVTGGIDSSMATKTIKTLQKIRKDPEVKCVVMRVDSTGGTITASEAILQECKSMPQPIVCSFGNVAASGGYYISAACSRIFALPCTYTGSIGVLGIKLDISGLAKKYGIKVEHIGVGPLASNASPFQPLTNPMKVVFARNIDRSYRQFKDLVSANRGLSQRHVEAIAQGRVWTGEQGVANGLVDEIGGLEHAIEFAKKTYTGGDATVERFDVIPPWKQIAAAFGEGDPNSLLRLLLLVSGSLTDSGPKAPSSEAALAKFLSGLVNLSNPPPCETWLAMDENTALSFVLDQGSR